MWNIELHANWVNGAFSEGDASYQHHPLNHAEQDWMMSRHFGLDIFRKRLAEASAAQSSAGEAQNS